jgi:hypothetical protein
MFLNEIFLRPESREKLLVFKDRTINREREILVQIVREASRETRWGQLTRLACRVLLAVLGSIYSDKTPEWMKSKASDWKLLPNEKKLLFTGSRTRLAKEYLLLLMARKLVGALKQEINRRIQELEPLGIEEEENLFAEVSLLEEVEIEDVGALIQDGYFPHSAMPLAGKLLRNEEVITISEKKPLPCGCPSINLGRYWNYKKSEVEEIEKCLSCGKTISMSKKKKEPEKPIGPCRHPNARWAEGREGKDAVCTKCEAPIENPGRFLWEAAGLEPFGDDPSKDETIPITYIFHGEESPHAPANS